MNKKYHLYANFTADCKICLKSLSTYRMDYFKELHFNRFSLSKKKSTL